MQGMRSLCLLLSFVVLVQAAALFENFEQGTSPFSFSATGTAPQIVSGGADGTAKALRVSGNGFTSNPMWNFTDFTNMDLSFWVKVGSYATAQIEFGQRFPAITATGAIIRFLDKGNFGLVRYDFGDLAYRLPYAVDQWYFVELQIMFLNNRGRAYVSVNGQFISSWELASNTYAVNYMRLITFNSTSDLYIDEIHLGCPAGCNGAGSCTVNGTCSCDVVQGSLSYCNFDCAPRIPVTVTSTEPLTFSSNYSYLFLRLNYSAYNTGLNLTLTSLNGPIQFTTHYSTETCATFGVPYTTLSAPVTTTTISITQCYQQGILGLGVQSADNSFQPVKFTITAAPNSKIIRVQNGRPITVDKKTSPTLFFPLEGKGPFKIQYQFDNLDSGFVYLANNSASSACGANYTSFYFNYKYQNSKPWTLLETRTEAVDLYFQFYMTDIFPTGVFTLTVCMFLFLSSILFFFLSTFFFFFLFFFFFVLTTCTNLTCSGHGVCYNDACSCETNYGGPNCDSIDCYKDCGHGFCTKTAGGRQTCVCDDKWGGENCNCPYAADLNKDTVKDVIPTAVGVTYYRIDVSKFPNGANITLKSLKTQDFSIGYLRNCEDSQIIYTRDNGDAAVASIAHCPYWPSVTPATDYYLVAITNVNVFSSYSLEAADAGLPGRPLNPGQHYKDQNIASYSSNGPTRKQYTVTVPETQGVRVQLTVLNPVPTPSRSYYSSVALYGANYTCATKNNNFVSTVGSSSYMQITANCVSGNTYFIAFESSWDSELRYEINATLFASSTRCDGPPVQSTTSNPSSGTTNPASGSSTSSPTSSASTTAANTGDNNSAAFALSPSFIFIFLFGCAAVLIPQFS